MRRDVIGPKPVLIALFIISVCAHAQETVPPNTVEAGTADLVREEPLARDAEGEPARQPTEAQEPVTYVPMPLPQSEDDPRGAEGEEVAPSVPVSFDLEARSESHGSPLLRRRSGAVEGHTDGSIGDWTLSPGTPDDRPLEQRNFSNLSFVGNPEDHPWRVAVKLFMDFRDTGGNLRGYVCSGTLIDPMHVITAGHCIYAHSDDDNGWTFNDWAESITVIPGFENGVRPYGSARALELHSYTGWTSDEDHDHDIGIIDLNRPVGALTGWHGYGWYGSCGSFTSNNFRHAGYPAASPFNGNWLYTNAGDYDSCETFLGIWTGNEVRFNKQSWGGQSGSGSYQPQSSCPSCWVRAVLSNGTNSYTDDVRINEGKFNNIGSIISNDTYGSFNLVPLDTVAGPSGLVAGNPLSIANFLLHNYSSASFSGTVDLDVYLSSNDLISTGDIFLGGYSWTGTLGAKGSIRLNLNPKPTIPNSVPGGSYFVGVLVDASDAVTADNNTEGDDTAPINVTGAPNLVVQSPSTSSSSVNAGSAFTLSMTVRNSGNGPSTSSILRYYRSGNSIISGIDTPIGTDFVSSLAAGSTSPESIGLTANLNRGTYYFGGCVDPVPNETSTANCSAGVSLQVKAPDLVVSSFSLDSLTVVAAGTLGAYASVKNQGDGSSTSTTMHYYLSTDSKITAADTLLLSQGIGALASGGSQDKSAALPIKVPLGSYWIGACVDPTSNDQPPNNNCSAGKRILVVQSIFEDDFESGNWLSWSAVFP